MMAVALVLASHDRQPADDPDTTAQASQPVAEEVDAAHRLPGTWLREHDEQGVRSRRLLRLEPDGDFSEQVRIEVSEHDHAGTWFYDGTNLKRKYTQMNGGSPSRLNLPFVTFEIRFETRNEFVGVDHIHRNTVRYRRVQPETQL